MISLLFKFFGDSTPLKQEADKAKVEMGKKGGEIGAAFGSQFKGFMMSTIGITAIAATIKKLATDAVQIEKGAIKMGMDTDAYQELARAAESVGMSVEELREVAPQLSSEFEKLISAVQSSGGIMDAETVRLLSDGAAEMKNLVGSFSTVLGVAANAFGWVRAAGEKAITVVTGSVMAATGLAGQAVGVSGAGDFRQAGSDMAREAAATPISGFKKLGANAPAREFMQAAASKAESDRLFNEMVDATNRMIEEQQKTREAIERS